MSMLYLVPLVMIVLIAFLCVMSRWYSDLTGITKRIHVVLLLIGAVVPVLNLILVLWFLAGGFVSLTSNKNWGDLHDKVD